MRTEYISSQNFGQLHRYRSLMSKELFNQVSQAPCVEKFAKGYSANVFVTKIQSSKQPGTKHLALVFENIKPNTIFTKIKRIFTKNKTKTVTLKTHSENETDYINEITKFSSNSFPILTKYEKYPLSVLTKSETLSFE